MWLLILYYFFNILYSSLYLPFSRVFLLLFRLLSFTSLNAKHVLQFKTFDRFNYKNPRSIIIAIFHAESVHFLNWKVYQLKCISTLNTLFSMERNLFHWEEDWNQSQRQCTKSAQKSASKVILLYRCLCLS